MNACIERLHVYPVKSLRGYETECAELTPTGLRWDRQWLVIDGRGRFLSQRAVPAMARIRTSVTPSALVLERDGLPACEIALELQDGVGFTTEIWGDRCEVVDQGDAAAGWLARALGEGHAPRLVRMAPGYDRPQKRPDRYGQATTTFFADTAPFLVVSTGSLAALNRALADDGLTPVPMNRFRGNIVVEGLEAFAEQSAKTLTGPAYRLGLRYPRERCVVTTIDQQTGQKDPGDAPFATLRRINPMPDNPMGPAFGMLSVLESAPGVMTRVGDAVRLS